MTDRYIAFANSNVGRRLVGALGLPAPVRLERWSAGRTRPVDGALLLGGEGNLNEAVLPFAERLTDSIFAFSDGQYGLPRWTAEHGPKLKAIVFDASGLTRFEQTIELRTFFQGALKGLDKCPHVVILGRAPESIKDPIAASVQRSLEGFSRSLGKEIRRGGNVQLVYVGKGAEDQLEGALRFFLSPKSAYVSGQVVRLSAYDKQVQDWSRPLVGKRALVTGAARGIGAAIAETLARDGAEVVLLDVPPAKDALDALAARLGGRGVALDICAADAGEQLVAALPDGVDIVVHNAGITRDKTVAKMSEAFWNSVIEVNLKAPQVLTQALLDANKLHDDGRVVLLASISGIAGNMGQTNYAVSKAGLIGLAQAWAPALGKKGISINAVAPGFIETQMTAAIPLTIREAGRRMNSMGQGGLPQDVAEAVAWFAQPGSGAVSGQVLRVCGQSLLGA
ncbi:MULTISPECIES: 3-oxoacyl-ACP reductase [Pseudomonas nitroreducens/multiresinivorans group]|uniref:3-oxoacyl-ACP reductase n=3 Tax=Pseudomonas nitroreducens/multiresinivorans group TaxID=627141 RepID=A0ABS0KTT6_PSENT|nr:MULTISPECIES: 3-oxoacyl-ACP reductase [Pseudomonas nitroreducens/multiresinivorans group]MBG6290750.1 3-oxoacyl-ACP reductase [Pseudomonas nitroreducens]MCJ1881898.1 3-oxoacyl-ACP reductase [Pseudomonas nitroreducens]MCJ1895552.1 3-oxoacyl-ACP reductase [Pseudomonas nitroreducens]NMZ60398.1 3-oxoacyl-ACP reductase [Pseudomonas nitroreducens]QJP07599.1 3-oxoacyl-ACP reductase [Pseudomonas multiresinivorans]